MHQKLETLSADKHGDLRLSRIADYGFARDLSQTPIVMDEVAEIAKHLPIVFPSGTVVRPVALLGLTRGQSAMIDEHAQWRSAYVPAALRRYPFLFARHGQTDARQDVVMLDRDAPHFARGTGDPLFETGPDGPVPSSAVADAVAYLSRYQKAADAVPEQFAPLSRKNVLIERDLEVAQGDNRHRISGICVVDQNRLQALDDATLASWARNGLLGAIHAHWQSLGNVRRLTG